MKKKGKALTTNQGGELHRRGHRPIPVGNDDRATVHKADILQEGTTGAAGQMALFVFANGNWRLPEGGEEN